MIFYVNGSDNSSAEYVTTKGGNLVLRTTAEKARWTEWSIDEGKEVQRMKNYTSGMVQTWNKFCFTGGVLEMSIELPGESNSGGWWFYFTAYLHPVYVSLFNVRRSVACCVAHGQSREGQLR